MKLSELKEQIKNIPGNPEIFMRCCVNPCGNIIEAGKATKSKYSSFGKPIDCIIIEPDIGESFVDKINEPVCKLCGDKLTEDELVCYSCDRTHSL